MEDFLKVKKCERCGRYLIIGRKVSRFNKQVICLHCLAKEDELKWASKESGHDPLPLGASGHIPER